MTMTERWNLYAFEESQKLLAGQMGGVERFLDCGECLAKEAEIHGFIATAPDYEHVLIWKRRELFYPAFLCKDCYIKYELQIDKQRRIKEQP